jgi:SAM-dependent methyltransferase
MMAPVSTVELSIFNAGGMMDPNYLTLLNSGDTVDGSLFFAPEGFLVEKSVTNPDWSPGTIGYAGFVFDPGTGPLYGWLQVEFAASGLDFTVLQSAYDDPGVYDLILCHGTFSWVPDNVKRCILKLCRRGLAPTGVAAIAYPTYPGWKQREAIRELVAARAQGFDDPAERVRQAALLLRLLHAGYSASESCHAQSLKEVVESMQRTSANAFLHDELGVEHDPCFFVQFAEWASECGLTYLAETELGSMLLDGLPASAIGLLRELDPDVLEAQQLIDFLVNRSGRSSLLVRDDAPMARKISLPALKELHFSLGSRAWASARPALTEEDEDLHRLTAHLTDACPEAVPFEELAALGLADTARTLLALLSRGFVDPQLPL